MEASVNIGLFRWEQYLKFCEIGDAIYFDEGNGSGSSGRSRK
jgi:hypothetical protein